MKLYSTLAPKVQLKHPDKNRKLTSLQIPSENMYPPLTARPLVLSRPPIEYTSPVFGMVINSALCTNPGMEGAGKIFPLLPLGHQYWQVLAPGLQKSILFYKLNHLVH